MAQNIARIQKTISSIYKKNPTSVVLSIQELHPAAQGELLEKLKKIDETSVDTDRKRKEKKRDSSEEEGRFIGRLKEKISTIKNETVLVKARFINCRGLLHMKVDENSNEAQLVGMFNKLSVFLVDLNVLQCMTHYKQGEIIAKMKNLGFTLDAVAKNIISPGRFVERLHAFYNFATRFPLLLVCGYSFETLLKFKSVIQKSADEDVDFCSRLELHISTEFEDERDDELMEEMEGATGNVAIGN